MSDEHHSPRMTLTIVSQKGSCAFGHKVGQQFDVSRGTPAGMCLSAFHSACPAIFALTFGAELPWEAEPGTAHVACPDGDNPLTMEIRRDG